MTIYSVEETRGMHFLAMELVEGVPLSHLIPEEGLPLEELLEISVSIAQALTAAHHKGMCASRSEAREHHGRQGRAR